MANKNDGLKTSRRGFLALAAAGTASAGLAACAPSKVIATSKSQHGPGERNRLSAPEGRAHYKIFSPFKIRNRTLKNRMVRSAAFEAGGTVEGHVKPAMIDIHSNYARGGVAMTMTGYMSVMDYGRKDTAVGAHDDSCIPELTRLATAVHAASDDIVFLAQIGHDGTAVTGTMGGAPSFVSPTGKQWPARISPSGIDRNGDATGYALTTAEVDRFCLDMGRAAERLEKAGFDGIQIHGAHHYLINTFISPFTNRRTDHYGGSFDNRLRILSNSIEEIRKRTGNDFMVLLKLNCDDGSLDDGMPGEINIKTFNQLAKAVEKMGVDAIDISGGEKPGDPMRSNISLPEHQSFYLPYAKTLDVNIPVILGCGNRNVEYLEEIVKSGDVDFFNFARPLIREPNLASRWLKGEGPAGATCLNTNLCFRSLYEGQGKSVRCIVDEQLQQTAAMWQDLGGFGV